MAGIGTDVKGRDMREITLGQYYKTDSVVHRLDPRTKLFLTVVFLIAALLVKNFFGFLILICGMVLYILLSKIPISFMLRGLKPIILVIAFSMLMHLFTRTGVVIWSLGWLRLTDLGVRNAVFTGLRLILMILGASVLTYTTLPMDLADGMDRGLHWMERFHVPVHDISMMISIALRFIPVLVEELNRIMKVQMSRGVSFDEGNVLTRLKKLIPIVVPLFVSAVRRSHDLAMAMDARCYHGGEGRTKLMPLQYQFRDYAAYGFMILYIAGLLVMAIRF